MENPPLPASHLTHRLRCLLSRTRVHMPSTEHNPMDPDFERRLKSALDRVTPPSSPPRYESATAGIRPMRFAPALLAGATAILLPLAATAATGSPNPVVWTQRAVSTIESVGHAPEASPSPPPSPERSKETPRSDTEAPTHEPDHEASPRPEPSDHPEESPRPEPSESPEPSGSHSGSGSSSPSPSPSPSSDAD